MHAVVVRREQRPVRLKRFESLAALIFQHRWIDKIANDTGMWPVKVRDNFLLDRSCDVLDRSATRESFRGGGGWFTHLGLEIRDGLEQPFVHGRDAE